MSVQQLARGSWSFPHADHTNNCRVGVMGEEIAKIGPEANIEIIEYHAGKVRSRLFITPQDGAYLARGLLACAAVLCGPDPPQAGTIFADSHIPVLKLAANASHSELVLTLTGRLQGL